MRAIFIVPALCLTIVCKKSSLKLEGNHASPAAAYELPPDKSLAGEFHGAEAVIYLKVQLREAAMLRAELSAARGVDSSLAVFHPPEKLLLEVDDNGSSLAEEIPPVYLPAGESLLRLRGKGGEHAAFTFFYRTFQPPLDIEREPNNSFATATKIEALRATGFYGPEIDKASPVREREKDCFLKEISEAEKRTLGLKLTGVDGIVSAVSVHDAAGLEILKQEAAAAGSPLSLGPVSLKGDKVFVCVTAVTTARKASRDYYDLTLTLGEATQRGETEPNNSPATAAAISEDQMEGTISAYNDADFFSYRNRREYPVSLRIDLESVNPEQLALTIDKSGQGPLVFENSAPRREVAENVRLEAGEIVMLAVKNRARLKKKNFKPAPYLLKFQETQASDENETEPNATPDKADTLVDLTQKWGFVNPLGDVDYYRLKLSAAERQLSFESKIDCKVRLEHLRSGKTVGSLSAEQNLRYTALFEKDDLIKVQCLGQKPNPPERAYRIALSEPG